MKLWLRHRPENKPLIKALEQFVRKQSMASILTDSWVQELWDYFDAYALPEIVTDSLVPLWNRILLEGQEHIQQQFLRRFKQFVNKNDTPDARKRYQSFEDDLFN